DVRIGLLGVLEISRNPQRGVVDPPFQVTAIKLRQILAMLAMNSNTMVSTEQLIDELWPYGPPRTGKTIVQTYVYQLRKLFSSKRLAGDVAADHATGWVRPGRPSRKH